jgi:predicted transposase YdaD
MCQVIPLKESLHFWSRYPFSYVSLRRDVTTRKKINMFWLDNIKNSQFQLPCVTVITVERNIHHSAQTILRVSKENLLPFW